MYFPECPYGKQHNCQVILLAGGGGGAIPGIRDDECRASQNKSKHQSKQ